MWDNHNLLVYIEKKNKFRTQIHAIRVFWSSVGVWQILVSTYFVGFCNKKIYFVASKLMTLKLHVNFGTCVVTSSIVKHFSPHNSVSETLVMYNSGAYSTSNTYLSTCNLHIMLYDAKRCYPLTAHQRPRVAVFDVFQAKRLWGLLLSKKDMTFYVSIASMPKKSYKSDKSQGKQYHHYSNFLSNRQLLRISLLLFQGR